MVKLIALLMLLSIPVMGQNYGFSIPEYRCRVVVNHDRSISIAYEMLFACEIGHHSIDIIDVGLPTDDYDIGSAEAFIDGETLHTILPSSYIDVGVEVHLSGRAIRQGTSGLFEFSCDNPDMVFLDSEKQNYASVEFTPTWFDGGMLNGTSSFRLEMVFPPGADPNDVYYHDEPFTESYIDEDGRVVFAWETTRRVDSSYMVGISFPSDLVEGPLRERPKKPLLSPATIALLSTFFIIFLVIAFIVIVMIIAIRKARKRREQYLPPTIGLEGSSVRRGLTAPMAALLLEEKLDRVFLMILFGLVKKGALQLQDGKLEKTGSIDGLRSYERSILEMIPAKGSIPGERIGKLFEKMIDELEEKMEGYSLEETRKYYRSVIRSAWKMVESDRMTDELGKKLGGMFQWLLADEDFDSRIRELPETGNIYLPIYMRSFTGAGKGGISISRACSEFAGFLENSAGRMVSNITSLSRTVTARTNPVPVSSYRGSSGSGCACACACAGCACACAGGGR
jgi:hypothetical protein